METLGDSFESYLRATADFWAGPAGIAVLKCSLAYLIASFAVFLTGKGGGIFGRGDNKHLVATITVYFHPARSQGSMHKASFLAFCAVLYAGTLSIISMLFTSMLASYERIFEAHIIVIFIFIGGGLGLVGWTKQRFGDPLVNVACSLASLTLITVLTREDFVHLGKFSASKFGQVLMMVLCGIIVSTAVSYLIKPIYARHQLGESMINVTNAFGASLAAITHAFLTGSEDSLKTGTFSANWEQFNTVFSTLENDLQENKWELYLLGREDEYHIEKRLVRCMQTLAQSIKGLRSAADTQFVLLRQPNEQGMASPNMARSGASLMNSRDIQLLEHGLVPKSGVLSPIYESDNESNTNSGREGRASPIVSSPSLNPTTTAALPTANSPGEIFERFTQQLGPSMVSIILMDWLTA
jgi:hypothetical protein